MTSQRGAGWVGYIQSKEKKEFLFAAPEATFDKDRRYVFSFRGKGNPMSLLPLIKYFWAYTWSTDTLASLQGTKAMLTAADWCSGLSDCVG